MESVGLTYEGILLRVAELNRLQKVAAGAVAAVPVDPNILDRLKRSVSDGIRLISRQLPRASFLRPVVRLELKADGTGSANIAGDAGRVRLPSYVQAPSSPELAWYAQGTGGSVTYRPFEEVEACRQQDSPDGYPCHAAIVYTMPGADERAGFRGLELILYPVPSIDITLVGQFYAGAFRFQELTDTSPWGPMHDDTIVAAADFVMNNTAAPDIIALKRQLMIDAIEQSRAVDRMNSVSWLGYSQESSSDAGLGGYYSPSRNNIITHYNGVEIATQTPE
jgi:hypothetical protein